MGHNVSEIDVEHLKEIATYNPITGDVVWKERGPKTFRRAGPYASAISERWNKNRAGRPITTVSPMGYVITCIEKRTVMAHRMAWAIYFGEWPQGQIDHINGNKSDNRLSNLRDVTAGENSQNKSRPKSNTSGCIGVHFHKPSQAWHARIMKNGKRFHLGAFNNIKEAKDAYENAKRKHSFHENHGR